MIHLNEICTVYGIWTRTPCNKSEVSLTALKDSAIIIFIPFFWLGLILETYTCIKRASETVNTVWYGFKIKTFNKNLSWSSSSKFRESIRDIVYEMNCRCFNWLGILTYTLSCKLSLWNARIYYILDLYVYISSSVGKCLQNSHLFAYHGCLWHYVIRCLDESEMADGEDRWCET